MNENGNSETIISFERVKDKTPLNLIERWKFLLMLNNNTEELTPEIFYFYDSDEESYEYDVYSDKDLFNSSIGKYSPDFWACVDIYKINKRLLNIIPEEIWLNIDQLIDEIKFY